MIYNKQKGGEFVIASTISLTNLTPIAIYIIKESGMIATKCIISKVVTQLINKAIENYSKQKCSSKQKIDIIIDKKIVQSVKKSIINKKNNLLKSKKSKNSIKSKNSKKSKK